MSEFGMAPDDEVEELSEAVIDGWPGPNLAGSTVLHARVGERCLRHAGPVSRILRDSAGRYRLEFELIEDDDEPV